VGASHITALPSSSDGYYDEDKLVELTADTPVAANTVFQWTFDHWSGDVSVPTNPTEVTMSAAKSATANYVKQWLNGFALTIPSKSGVTTDTGKVMPTALPDGPETTLSMDADTYYYWYSGSTYGGGSEISAGSYDFTFWYESSATSTMTFVFGYCATDGSGKIMIASATSGPIPSEGTPTEYSLTASTSSPTTLPSGTWLLYVKVSNSEAGTTLYHDNPDRDSPTNLLTPHVTMEAPEFPLGVGLFALFLISIYLTMKKKFLGNGVVR